MGPYEQPALMCGGLSSDGGQEEEKLSKIEVGVEEDLSKEVVGI